MALIASKAWAVTATTDRGSTCERRSHARDRREKYRHTIAVYRGPLALKDTPPTRLGLARERTRLRSLPHEATQDPRQSDGAKKGSLSLLLWSHDAYVAAREMSLVYSAAPYVLHGLQKLAHQPWRRVKPSTVRA